MNDYGTRLELHDESNDHSDVIFAQRGHRRARLVEVVDLEFDFSPLGNGGGDTERCVVQRVA